MDSPLRVPVISPTHPVHTSHDLLNTNLQTIFFIHALNSVHMPYVPYITTHYQHLSHDHSKA